MPMSVAVVASDSPEGREALVRAVSEANLRGLELVALAVVDTNSVSEEDREATTLATEQILTSRGVADATFSVRVEPDGGDPAGAIVDLVADTGAELLVIGSKRRSAVGKFLMGSTVQRVLLDSPVPVLVVKAPEVERGR
ncbi:MULTISPECIES: universal stress protein [Nocardiaceae]|jgi:nucleotide-binding universal stress UspA family protein|uniref:universal stress protein n=1 Tax=Nocardiaceae TaxID=85025 RepID=UPI000564E891|nr:MULTISPECIES: universal stress protein [Rhodococcus]OZF04727.1 universal stress protein [Rhodococcus sp. 15-1189-1-1a]OZF18991.1 universal stress protein [Rhodococcus sp. 14-2686-1-2]OZF55711.1 universal stress protein [Rhodococcus sp. 14-2470-1b]